MLSLFRRLSKDQKRMLLTCFLAFFVTGTLTLTLGSVMPDLRAAYGLSDIQSGMMISAHSIGTMIAGFTSGLAPLVLGRRRSIVLLAAFTALGVTLMMFWGNPLFLIFCFICTGIGRGSVTNFNNAMVNQVSHGSPVAANLLHATFAVGAFTAPMMFLLWNGVGGWRMGLGYVAVINLCVVLAFSLQHFEDDRPDPKDKTASTLVFLKNPSFLILAAMMFFYLCAEYSINGWLVTYMQNKPSLAIVDIKAYSQSLATLFWLVILIGRLTCALLASRFAPKKLMLFFSVAVVGFFIMMLLGNSVTVVTISVVGLGFCMAGICPMIYADAGVFTNTYAMATSTLLAAGSAGAIFMPTIVGATAQHFGFTSGMATILVAILLLLALTILNATVKTRIPKEMLAKETPVPDAARAKG